jgi:hypothetical protein
MDVWVFGNPDLPQDALPLQLLPQLKRRFPQHTFQTPDPNEEWRIPDQLVVIDTVQGIEQVQTFSSLDQFQNSPRVTMHDVDAGLQLKWLQKMGKLKNLTIIGVPMGGNPDRVLTDLVTALARR